MGTGQLGYSTETEGGGGGAGSAILNPIDAYMPHSVACDLTISEIVDAPNWIVTAYCPVSIFG